MMRKKEMRVTLSPEMLTKLDHLRSQFGGISRSGLISIAIVEMADRYAEKEAASIAQKAA
jgi:metal-responsive CopG/Arc/MetJ family transcriptional regulator